MVDACLLQTAGRAGLPERLEISAYILKSDHVCERFI